MKILANDPSITAWGWVVLKFKDGTPEIIDSGCIKTEPESKARKIRKSDDRVRRLDEISRALQDLHMKHRLDWVVSELPHGSQNAQAAMTIGAVAGLMSCYAVVNELPIEWYSEGDCKKHLLGKRSATKKETIDCIIRQYGDEWVTGTKYKDEAVADALAVFHIAKDTSPSLRHAYNLSRR